MSLASIGLFFLALFLGLFIHYALAVIFAAALIGLAVWYLLRSNGLSIKEGANATTTAHILLSLACRAEN
jgi:hypothetical protein